jgi:hypothetical protein
MPDVALPGRTPEGKSCSGALSVSGTILTTCYPIDDSNMVKSVVLFLVLFGVAQLPKFPDPKVELSKRIERLAGPNPMECGQHVATRSHDAGSLTYPEREALERSLECFWSLQRSANLPGRFWASQESIPGWPEVLWRTAMGECAGFRSTVHHAVVQAARASWTQVAATRRQ